MSEEVSMSIADFQAMRGLRQALDTALAELDELRWQLRKVLEFYQTPPPGLLKQGSPRWNVLVEAWRLTNPTERPGAALLAERDNALEAMRQFREDRDYWRSGAQAALVTLQQAQADAAALASKLNELLNEIDAAEEAGSWPKQGIVDSGWRLDAAEHPGAALLAELEAARRVVEAARTRDRGNIDDALYDYDKATHHDHPS